MTQGCLLLVYASYAFRFLAYAFLVPSPWVTVPVDLFHGLTFGLMWATSASYANVIAPEGRVGRDGEEMGQNWDIT
jgi:hypothetical protein